jgi:ESS family glutamate:Na+ symporter
METDRQTIILEGQGQIPLVDAIDKLTIQFAIVGFIYLLAWIIIFSFQQLILELNIPFLVNNIIPLLYGFNFIIVVFVAMLYKVITKQLLKSKVMSRIYTNDFMLNRIAGFAFDVMMIASIMAIDISVVIEPGFLMTISILSIGGTILTYLYLEFLSHKVYPDYPHEAFLIFYGTMTGTASTGVALLREKDPYFKTPAANDIVYGSSMAIPLGFPLLLFVGFITLGWVYIGVILVVLIAIFVSYHYFLTKKHKI